MNYKEVLEKQIELLQDKQQLLKTPLDKNALLEMSKQIQCLAMQAYKMPRNTNDVKLEINEERDLLLFLKKRYLDKNEWIKKVSISVDADAEGHKSRSILINLPSENNSF